MDPIAEYRTLECRYRGTRRHLDVADQDAENQQPEGGAQNVNGQAQNQGSSLAEVVV